MPQEEDEFVAVSIFTDASVFTYLIIASIGIIVGLELTVFIPNTEVQLITAMSIICTCLSMFGILKLMKYGMGYIHKKRNTGEINRCRNQMIIGFGGISMCGIITRIVFFYVGNLYILYYCFITSSVTFAMFYYYFLNEFREKWRVTYEKKYIPLISILSAIQIIVLIITMIIKIAYSDEGTFSEQRLQRIHFEFWISVFSAPSIIDIGVVLAGGIKKNQNVSALGKPIMEDNSPRPEEEGDNIYYEMLIVYHFTGVFYCIFLGILFLAFQPITQTELITASSVFCTCLSMLGIAKLVKYVLVHKRHNTGEMEQCRDKMIIGFAGISMCGIIQGIVFSYVDNLYILYYFIVTSCITCLIFYYHFIYDAQKKWRVNYKQTHETLLFILWVYGSIVFVITANIAGYYRDRSAELFECSLVRFVIFQFYVLMIFGRTITDLVMTISRGIKKIKENLEMESVKVVQPSTHEDSSVESKDHPASQLPKNFAVTNMIDEKM